MGLVAILGLTGMNVYSLYSLHESTVTSKQENQKSQLIELTNQVRHRFTSPLNERFRLNIREIRESFQTQQPMHESMMSLLETASSDSLFSEIYVTDADCKACEGNGRIQKYNPHTQSLEWVSSAPEEAQDGINLASTNMSVLINDYRWNTRIFFDTHRSLTLSINDSRNQEVIGFVNLIINKDYLLDSYLKPKIENSFSPSSESGIVLWLHDWTQDEILATSDPSVEYDFQIVNTTQNFPDLLNNWNLKASFTENPTVAASRASLIRNLTVLGGAVLLLIGALVFMFMTAQRERKLAQRQAGFLANVTHELKTPLAVMQAAGENLSDGRVDDVKRLSSYGRHIHSEALRLRSMIDKLLDVAKSDSGQLKISPQHVNLVDEVEKYLKVNRKLLEVQNFTVDFKYDDSIPSVYIDTDNFDTILGNLVENAVKYSENEKYLGIHISNTGKYVRIDITDKGKGIPYEDQKLIFDKFYRVEDTLTANTKGHGLGLSIVRDLTELNNGRIAVDSKENEGSVFSLYFPVSQKNINKTEHLNNGGTYQESKRTQLDESTTY